MSGWVDRAACRDADPELFWPVTWGPAYKQQIIEAKVICYGCPVWRECLQEAIHKAEDGIRGGTTEPERRSIRRRLGKSAAPPAPDAPRKACSRCGIPKVLTAFPIRTRSSDGLDSSCKDCKNLADAERLANKRKTKEAVNA